MFEYRDTDLGRNLRRALAMIPYNNSYSHNYEQLLFKILYFALSNESKYFNLLFSKLSNSDNLPKSWDEIFTKRDAPNDMFYKSQFNHKSKGHLGRICACEIPNGKLVYNCYDCGVDATCCMCDDCFNKEEHSDHNVSVHNSTGGAICDCGDHSSWKLNLICNATELEKKYLNKLPPLSNDLKETVKIVIRTIFDYIIDTNVTNIQTIPEVNDLLHSEYKDFDKFIKLSTYHSLPSDVYGIDDKLVNDEYHLLVWNDEFHNFDEAISLLKSGSISHVSYPEFDHNGKSIIGIEEKSFLENQAKYIDEIGVTSLCQVNVENYPKLLESMQSMNYLNDDKKGLTTSIASKRDYIRLCVSRYILNWLNEILKNDNWNIVNLIQEEISNCLLEEAIISHKSNPASSIVSCFSMLDESFRIPIFKGVSLDNISDSNYIDLKKLNFQEVLNTTINDQDDNYIEYTQKRSTRLQYLMFLEMRLPKKVRKILKNLIIPIITSTSGNRFKYAEQIMSMLPVLELLNFKYDREHDLSLLDSYRLQVYHDPNIGTQLLQKNNLLENVLSSCLSTLSHSIKFGKYFMDENNENWESIKRHSITRKIVEGFKTILMFIHNGSDEMFYQSFFLKIIIWFSAYDELFKFKRKIGSHVEYQNHSICRVYHSEAHRMFEVASLFGKYTFNLNERNHHLEESITILSSYLKLKETKYNDDKSMVVFDVTNDGVTMIHPLNSLLGELIKGYKFFNLSLIQNTIKHVHLLNGCVTFSNKNETFLGVADEALQPFVYSSQIVANFWVRNGDDVRIAERFFNYYYNPDSLLHIIQLGLLTKELSLKDILDRYMFTNYYENGEDFDKSIYLERASNILTDLMHLFYHLFSYRLPFDSQMSYEKFEELKTIIQLGSVVGSEPLKYSAIKREFQYISDFEDLLNKVADYVPPSSFNDYGKYKLKLKFIENYDPFHILNNKTPSESIEESMLEQLSKDLNKKVDDLILTPRMYELNDDDKLKFKPICEFFKSKDMVKFIYKILSFAINTDNDSHLNITLHLIHAIILDADEDLNNFINIPICNLLLGTAEKEGIPKYIAKKASTILELLLLKDDSIMESLIECFGEAKIDEYKKSKHGKTLETKLERAKRLALKRQKKIMKKMIKQQNKFVDKNSEYFDDDEMDGNDNRGGNRTNEKNKNQRERKLGTNSHLDDIRNCIICKNPENNDEIFGVPGNIVSTSVFWNIPTIDNDPPSFMVEEFDKMKGLPVDHQHGIARANCSVEKPIIFGCPHAMHYQCFLKMLKDKQQKHDYFQCPLCEGSFNVFIPSLKMKNFEFDLNTFDESIKIDEIFNPINNGQNIPPTLIFNKEFVHELNNPNGKSYKVIMKEILDFSSNNLGIFVSGPLYKVEGCESKATFQNGKFLTFGLSNIISNSLESFEIISRGIENELVLPELQLRLLSSIMQYRTLLNYYDKYQFDEDRLNYFKNYLNDPKMGFIQTSIMLFLEGDLQLEDIFKISIIKFISNICLSMVNRYKHDKRNIKFESILDNEVDLSKIFEVHSNNKLASVGHGLMNVLRNLGEINEIDDALIKNTYKLIKTNLKNYERQVELIKQLLNFTDDEDNKLHLPNIDEIIESFNNELGFNYKLLIKFIPRDDLYLDEDDDFLNVREKTEILGIDYPLSSKLIELPNRLKDTINLEVINKSNKPELVCLNCGELVKPGLGPTKHVGECQMSRFSILIFNPMKNVLKIHFTRTAVLDGSIVESPYLNKHGEPSHGIVGFGDSGTLNLKRYEHLQKVFFDQTLLQTISRKVSGGINRLIRRTMTNTSGCINTLHFPGLREPHKVNITMATPREFFINNFMNDGRIDPRVTQMLRDGWIFQADNDDDDLTAGFEGDDDDDDDSDFDDGDMPGPWMLEVEEEDEDEDVREMEGIMEAVEGQLEEGEDSDYATPLEFLETPTHGEFQVGGDTVEDTWESNTSSTSEND